MMTLLAILLAGCSAPSVTVDEANTESPDATRTSEPTVQPETVTQPSLLSPSPDARRVDPAFGHMTPYDYPPSG